MAPSARRLADQRRIRIATLLMASCAAVGTGIVDGLAPAATHTKSNGTTSQSTDDSTRSDLTAPSSVPASRTRRPSRSREARDERVRDVRGDRRSEPAVIDSDAAVSLPSALLPVGPGVWLALGALAFDLVAAIVVTSLIRKHLPYRLWRTIHWAAYASWPFAIWHGIGMGSDAATWWLRGVTILCVAWFAGVVVWRLSRHDDLAPA